MLRLPRFQFLAPDSLDGAISLIKEHEGKVKVMAGGTDLLPSLKQSLFTPEYVLDLKKISRLNQIEEGSNGRVRIGALTTLSSIEKSPVIKKHFPGLSEAADSVAATQIKNMGTIGGNISLETRCWYFNQSHFWRKSIEKCRKFGGEVCHVVKGGDRCYAYFAADTVPVLVALGAKVKIRSSEGERECDLKEIYTQDGKSPNNLKVGDLITEITIPISPGKSGNAYKKLRLRGAIDFPLVGAAVNLSLDGGSCQDVKVVLGAVESGPIEVEGVEEVLKGKEIKEGLIEEVGELARKAAKPVVNTATSPGYRRKMAGVFTRRALREALNRARSS
jgi:4-hydroxybenzoyl-CoA reductase subunit beta